MRVEQLPLCGGGTLAVYLREASARMPNALRRPMVIVVPGGGYEHVSPREGDPVALQFAAAGYHTAVLTYSVGEQARNCQPLRQLSEALGLVRVHAEEWGVLPEKIAVCGFSAGGHLALSGAVLSLPEGGAMNRPNALVLAYPVVTAGEYAHRGSFCQLMQGSSDPAAHAAFTLEDKITPSAPPTFLGTPWRMAASRGKQPAAAFGLHKAGVALQSPFL